MTQQKKFKSRPIFVECVRLGRLSIVKKLLKTKDALKIYGQRALTCAAIEGRNEMIELLLENGVSINEKDIFNCYPLLEAARWNRSSTVSLLLEKGAEDIERALDLAIHCKNYESADLILEYVMKQK